MVSERARQWAIDKAKLATPSTSRNVEGGTPKIRRCATCGSTGTGPVSVAGSSCTAVSPDDASARAPHSAQKRAFAGSLAPQLEHLARGTDSLPVRLGAELEGA